MTYVDMKAKADKLNYEIKNERRKIEINNITFHKAKKALGIPDFQEFQCRSGEASLLY